MAPRTSEFKVNIRGVRKQVGEQQEKNVNLVGRNGHEDCGSLKTDVCEKKPQNRDIRDPSRLCRENWKRDMIRIN